MWIDCALSSLGEQSPLKVLSLLRSTRILFLNLSLFWSLSLAASDCGMNLTEGFRPKQISQSTASQMRKYYLVDNLDSAKVYLYGDENPWARKKALAFVSDEFSDLFFLANLISNVATDSHVDLIVGVGGSTSILVALLNVYYPDIAAINLPLSIPKAHSDKVIKGSKSWFVNQCMNRRVNQHQIAETMNVWRPFLESRVREGSKILLVDYVFSGETLDLSRRFFQTYLRTRSLKAEVMTLGFGHQQTRPWNRDYALGSLTSGEVKHWAINIPDRLYESFSSHRYKPLSEFPSYVPCFTDPDTLVPRPAYGRLLRWLKRYHPEARTQLPGPSSNSSAVGH